MVTGCDEDLSFNDEDDGAGPSSRADEGCEDAAMSGEAVLDDNTRHSPPAQPRL